MRKIVAKRSEFIGKTIQYLCKAFENNYQKVFYNQNI